MNEQVKWHRLESIASTNSYLAGLPDDKSFGCQVAVTSFQTAGRGQKGNSWESQPGKNLLFSILMHPSGIGVRQQFFISEAIAMAVSESVRFFLGPDLGSHVSVKWPNDIYWKDFKIAGILIEHTVMGAYIERSIVGVGLDVNQLVFESDAPNPMSMAGIAGHEFSLEDILKDIVSRFIDLMSKTDDHSRQVLDSRYRKSMYRGNGLHKFSDVNGVFWARIDHVEPTGCIVLETDAGENRTYEFKQLGFVLSE